MPAAHLIDDRTAFGFIGLQVHSIKKKEEEGIQVRWKNLKIITENLENYYKMMRVGEMADYFTFHIMAGGPVY